MRSVLQGRRDRRASQPLLVRARTDPEVFAEFYAELYEQVLAFFARRTLDPETAFDLMAETFAAAFAGLGGFRGETAEAGYAWFWTIARRQLGEWRRRGAVSRAALQQLGLEPLPMSETEFERVEELADIARLQPEIVNALSSLPADQQRSVELRVIDELSYEIIARRLDTSEQVVRARVSRGLRALARLLEPAEEEPGVTLVAEGRRP